MKFSRRNTARAVLENAGFDVVLRPLQTPDPINGAAVQLVVVDGGGRMDDALVEDFKALGVTTRLGKPFTEAQLAEALKHLLAPK